VIGVNNIIHDFSKFLLNTQYVRSHPDFINVNYAFRQKTRNLSEQSLRLWHSIQAFYTIMWFILIYINDVNNSGKWSVM